jgi:hypothetical protein
MKKILDKGTYCWLEEETLSDGSKAYNVVVFSEAMPELDHPQEEIQLSPATEQDAVRLFNCIEKLGSV